MREIIVTVKNMAKANFYGQTVRLMKENSLKITLKEKVLINGLMEECMWGIGRIIKWMEEVFLLGKMVENMKVIIKMIKNMVMVCLNGLMEEFIKDIGSMVDSMEKVLI